MEPGSIKKNTKYTTGDYSVVEVLDINEINGQLVTYRMVTSTQYSDQEHQSMHLKLFARWVVTEYRGNDG